MTTTNPTPHAILADLWQLAGLPAASLAEAEITGAEPTLPSSFRAGAAAGSTVAAAGLAAAEVHRRRTGVAQRVAVDLRHAAIEFRSERHLRVDDAPPHDPWDSIAGLYPTAGGGHVRLHTNFPHHRAGVLRLLGCDGTREAVAAALLQRDAVAFEAEATAAGLVVAALRSLAEWDAHPQGVALAPLPVLTIERIGDAPPLPWPAAGDRPLSGLRALDLTRVIAGPVAGRTLAAHGAEVLHLTGPHLPSIAPLVMDTGRGKRSASLDLRDPASREALRGLVRGADLFVQSYRAGALAAQGFGPVELASLRPGLVIATLSAYGEVGPWAGKRGFDSLVQTATGINAAEAEAYAAATGGAPAASRVLPCQALDHGSGQLLAFGALAALLRQRAEGGTWLVRVALATTGHWLRRLGRLPDGFAAPDPGQEAVADLLETTESGFGLLTAVRHAAQLSATPARYALPAVPLGTHPAAWAP